MVSTPSNKSPVVMLPGLFAGGWMWDATRAFLIEHGYSVVVIEKAYVEIGTSLDALRADLHSRLTRLPFDSFTLCGNSLGGLVALDYAASHPELVGALAVCGVPGLGERAHLGVPIPRSLKGVDLMAFGRAVVNKLFYNPDAVTDEMIERSAALLGKIPNLIALFRLLRVIDDYSVESTLHQIACPTLLLWGAEDVLTPSAPWVALLDQFHSASFRAVPQAGHSPMMERSEIFNSILLSFLQQTLHTPMEHVLNPVHMTLTNIGGSA